GRRPLRPGRCCAPRLRTPRAPAPRKARMDVVVTGSHGLIGTALVGALAAAGHRPSCLVRGSATGVDTIAWDPDAGTIDAPRLEGVDAIVHLAGAGIGDARWTGARK